MKFLRTPHYATVSSLLLIASLTACSNDLCTDNQNSVPKAQFVNASLDAPVTPDTITITGIGAPADTPLYSAGTALSEIYLPLRPDEESTAYLFHYTSRDVKDEDTGEIVEDHTKDDILVFYYTTTPVFSGADCGALFRYFITDLRHSTNGIDKIIIDDPMVTNTDKVRIYIALKNPRRPLIPTLRLTTTPRRRRHPQLHPGYLQPGRPCSPPTTLRQRKGVTDETATHCCGGNRHCRGTHSLCLRAATHHSRG